jgi:Fic family protein
MNPADFTQDKWGQVLRDPKGHWAFVPHPLPPKIESSWQLTTAISEADRALSELAGTGRNLPNPHLLIGPFIRREAVLSSRIEGTLTSLSDLFYFEAVGLPRGSAERAAPDVQEVANYVAAMEYGLRRLNELPMCLRLIREMHARLMHGVRGRQRRPGEFRNEHNWIGPNGCTVTDATFVPPPVAQMTEALNQFEKFLHNPPHLPPLVRMALVHYQFEAIHPFEDGNGRIGRLLISLLLCHEGLLHEPLLYLSAFFEQNRDEYYRLLLRVSQAGEWTEWLTFFLEGVAGQSRDAIWRATRLLELLQEYRDRVTLKGSSALLLGIVEHLFVTPFITIGAVSKRSGITHRAATLNVQKLVDAGILEEVTGRRRNKVFLARRIVEVTEEQRTD